MHTLDLEQQRYDSMLPPDNSTTEEEVEDKVSELIERHGLDWLEQHVSTETWGNIVTALVSTHSRPKAAGLALASSWGGHYVSTHSRPKAAGSPKF